MSKIVKIAIFNQGLQTADDLINWLNSGAFRMWDKRGKAILSMPLYRFPILGYELKDPLDFGELGGWSAPEGTKVQVERDDGWIVVLRELDGMLESI